ncbi:MAG TPA: CBS domain-containing protein [Flavobacteriaceae bacterium]|nr:CBS domain-containing protein [Flavobacteriaceae bacterium]HBS12048.1 CBS domain-containing protein [Flavobacteriaceae bacterium]
MKKREPISKIMTQDVITLTLNDSLMDAKNLFKKHHIRHIPIVENDRIIGMLSLTDLLRISFVDAYSDDQSIDTTIYNLLSIGQVMANDPVNVSSNSIIKDVASLLAAKEFHALPVVDNEKLVGIITTTDLLNYLVDLY